MTETSVLPASDLPVLPVPLRRRWQPLRAGLVDLYYYDDQDFWFHDGRLLLRGNNGAGKSKVLALLLPFLFDGETAGHRLEPDGDSQKKMEWNLLLGGEHPNPERTGYSWLELGRLDEDGREHVVTIGFGVKAARGRGVVKKWFFTAAARVGVDLHLVDASRTVLTQDRLEAALEALPGHGRVTTTARDHRHAVDELFFGLGEQRYTALVDLLVQLRQPQLSRKPSESKLSDALTAALPPLDQAVLSDVAESYRSLEEDRAALDRTVEAHAGARSFLGHYRGYARVAARRAAAPPRSAQARYDETGRTLAAARRTLEDSLTALTAAQEADRASAERVEVLQAREVALAKDPRASSVEVIQGVRRADEAAQTEATRAAERAARAAERADRAERQAADAVRRRDSAAAGAAAREQAVRDAAREATLPSPDELAAGTVEPLDVTAPPADLGPWQRGAQHAAERRRRDLKHLEDLARAQQRAADEHAKARAEVDRARSAVERAAERVAEAEAAQADAARALVRESAAWLQQLTELDVPDHAGALAAVETWAAAGAGAGEGGDLPLAALAAEAHAAAVASLTSQREAAEREAVEAGALVSALTEELRRLERGEHRPPALLPTREPGVREQVLGAPLWQLVELTDALDDRAAAGLEAALEASGLLDAWVGPDAGVRLAGDVVVHPHRGGPGDDDGTGSHLGELLRPADELPDGSGLTAEHVAAVLAGIGVGEAEGARGRVWVDVDGGYGTPVTSGSWRKERSEHLGASSRERARMARMAAARSELAEASQRELDAQAAADAVGLRLAAAKREAGSVPSGRQVLQAVLDVAARVRQREELRVAVVEASSAAARAASAAQVAAEALTDAATQLALPADAEERARVAAASDRWDRAVAVLWPALEALRAAREQAVQAQESAADERSAAQAATEELEQRRREAAAAHETRETMERTVGLDAAALLAEREEVDRDKRTAAEQRRAAQAALSGAERDAGAADSRVTSLAEQLSRDGDQRDAAVAAWQATATSGLLAVAVPEVVVPDGDAPWAAEPAVRLARAVEAALADVVSDDDALTRAQNRVTSEQRTIDDVLRPDGHQATVRMAGQLAGDAGLLVVDVVFRGRATTLVELEEALAADVAERTELLDAREREVIENYLIDEVASTLADLVSAAEAQVASMNVELEQRPTSAGMRLRLRWVPREDGPAGLEAARSRLLRQNADAWSAADRAAVAAFLTAQVQAVRAADPGGSWLEQLGRALDYRTWHRFAVQRWQGGQWRAATGPASGGERVLAASVPLFAAAAAHYGSAPNPHAPRLVMLDEAFAGVDDTARADYLGLLAAFDLDVVMTSEREWGCYPQVPGLGIAQLSRLEGVDAVLVTPWRWDGRERTRADGGAGARPAGSATAPQPRREPELEQDGLFDS
ncbi:TIGR02680 family protein [Quadrisphaera granulorum]|uniref:Uncharacterized protein (TIGR02680 family) n=1 Tax=Quadrisphaera granulorum TaxID=317664 RepID=A0A316ACI6_9ACTN|nr:TIGR02680 family protein [Quadrisphaera granulorum]PWJ47487.1 uncharacterized protein (TIGR02680 family) [Quadrisphaera granulorum]SZE98788.1 TIGR02680 family protein [Quadrisphaera granulorum]